MADISLWQDKAARAAFEAKAKARLEGLCDELGDQLGVIAIEPESGDIFIGKTLGKANDEAQRKYPDKWLYFARLDNPRVGIALVTW